MHRVARALTVLCLLAATSRPAHSAWPHDPYSGGLVVSNATTYQSYPTIVSDGAGGFITAWQDLRNGTQDIYVQRVSAAGVPLWTANGAPVCVSAGQQYRPQVISDGAGGAIVAWYDARSGTFDIYAQRVNASGTMLWGANGLAVCTAAGSQTDHRLAPDGAGGAILAWQDPRGVTYDIYAQRVSALGITQWAANGIPLCTAANAQFAPKIVSDGAGGAIVAWYDDRSGTSYDIYAQRVNDIGTTLWAANGNAVCTATGSQIDVDIAPDGGAPTGGGSGAVIAWVDGRAGTNYDIYCQRMDAAGIAQWAADGIALCTATGNQTAPKAVSDGAGGAIVTWADDRTVGRDIYAQRASMAGSALWTANGVAVCTASDTQDNPMIAPDGAGGAVIGWTDQRGGTNLDIYAQRVASSGSFAWTSNGVLVSAAPNGQLNLGVVTDGAGGAILAWEDERTLFADDIYAQRVHRFGQLGSPEPVITQVKDVRNDQGGWVKVSWNASYLDADPTFGVLDYRLWRSVPAAALTAGAMLARGFTADPDEAAAGDAFLVMPMAAQDYAWELVGTQGAAILPSYSLVAATTGDSLGGSNPLTAFMVEARAGTSLASDRWFSAPDSGYSVDNLAPAAPAPFTAQYGAGTTLLHWNPNTEADLAGYRLYRGSSLGFVPDESNLVAALPDTGHVDAAGAPYVYKLTAVDAHGNESPVATVVPAGTTAVEGDAAPRAFFALGSANPVRSGGATVLRFGLATAGRASVALYDATGRRVRELAAGAREAGEHALAWDGRDDAGRAVAPGLYFARLETAGFTATRKLVMQD